MGQTFIITRIMELPGLILGRSFDMFLGVCMPSPYPCFAIAIPQVGLQGGWGREMVKNLNLTWRLKQTPRVRG
jgi:hypothetical protein